MFLMALKIEPSRRRASNDADELMNFHNICESDISVNIITENNGTLALHQTCHQSRLSLLKQQIFKQNIILKQRKKV